MDAGCFGAGLLRPSVTCLFQLVLIIDASINCTTTGAIAAMGEAMTASKHIEKIEQVS